MFQAMLWNTVNTEQYLSNEQRTYCSACLHFLYFYFLTFYHILDFSVGLTIITDN